MLPPSGISVAHFISCSIVEHQWNICSNNFKQIGADVLMRRLTYDMGKLPTDQCGTLCQTMIFCDVSMLCSVWGTGFMWRMNTALGDNELKWRFENHYKDQDSFSKDDVICQYKCKDFQKNMHGVKKNAWIWISAFYRLL